MNMWRALRFIRETRSGSAGSEYEDEGLVRWQASFLILGLSVNKIL